MKKLTFIFSLLVALAVNAQYSTPGFYRVHNVNTDSYISIKGTAFEWTTTPDAFWSCIVMQRDSAQVTDPGTIIYIPALEQTSLCSQGAGTYELTGLYMDVALTSAAEGGKDTYIATTQTMFHGRMVKFYFRDFGMGLTAGMSESIQCYWWIEPVNEESIEESYFGVKPASEDVKDTQGCYWTTLCCDFPVLLPAQGGVEGAYSVRTVKAGSDGNYHATAVKTYGQSDTVPAATPVLLKCTTPYAGMNKLIPVGTIAANTVFPLANDLLMGTYYGSFENYGSPTDASEMKVYVPQQSVPAAATRLALGVDSQGRLGFYPKADGTCMDANSAWLDLTAIEELQGVTAVYLDEAPELLMGDVDGDDKLTINDVTMLIDYMLGDYRDTRGEFNVDAADVDGDGKVGIGDVTLLIDMMLGTV